MLKKSPNLVQESILPNYDFFAFPIFAIKLGHFKVHTIFFVLQTLKLNNKNGKIFILRRKMFGRIDSSVKEQLETK